MDGIQKVPMSLMRKNFASYLRVANRGEQLIVTVDGEPLAVVGPLSAMSSVTLEQLGGSALYLLSELSGGVTGETHHVDSGYNIIGLPYLTGNEGKDA